MRGVLLAATFLLLASCARPKPGDPPQIVFGRHECARCGMIVSEERFAAGYVDDSGTTVPFDDLGELLSALAEREDLRRRSWVRDFSNGGWLRLTEAHVVKIEGLATPMGTGWVAFAQRSEAEAFLRARLRSW
ncbi:MAG: nitrous oxide reductase accessory protein NosL [Elusimicrobia bacterium]|nr:nitrous oxide reductase accessory protein NosL [Elusimicrobiota bacterium]